MIHDPLCDLFHGTRTWIVCQCDLINKVRENERQKLAATNHVSVARGAMDTSRKAAANVLPRSGTMKSTIYNLICFHGGLTDDEIEVKTGMAHQSASAARRGLVVAGLVIDSGERRKNRRGNDSAVWIEARNRDRSSSNDGGLGNASNRQQGAATIKISDEPLDGFWLTPSVEQNPKVDS